LISAGKMNFVLNLIPYAKINSKSVIFKCKNVRSYNFWEKIFWILGLEEFLDTKKEDDPLKKNNQ
jgi:hypothetical protein